MQRAALMRQLATARLLDPSPEAVERLDQSIIAAIRVNNLHLALRLMRFRKRVETQEPVEQRRARERVERLLEEAVARGVTGPVPPGQ
jgi:hypothetical protein